MKTLLSLLHTVWLLWSSRGERRRAPFLLLFPQQHYADMRGSFDRFLTPLHHS